jgi:3-methyladenine DNA glycosylase AlkD
MLQQLRQELKKAANQTKAKVLQRFFKTGKGHYGEGDVFYGIMVPNTRAISKKYAHLPLQDIRALLYSAVHEERLVALFILVEQYNKARKNNDNRKLQEYIDFYLKNSKQVNNWDLVDLSADKILGDYLLDKDKAILYAYANSPNLWQRRIAIISTFHFIKNNQFEDTFAIAELLLEDNHDLIHKAVGWMLREVGKRNQAAEESFLKKHYKRMPRTMLRYAIERFDAKKKLFYMGK